MQAAIPSHLKISSESVFILNEQQEEDIKNLSDAEYIISEALEIKKILTLLEIQKLLDKKSVYPVINKLIQKGICYVQENMKDKYTSKVEIFLSLQAQYKNEAALEKLLNEWTRAHKQLDLLLAFLHFEKTEGSVQQKSILEKANATHAQLKALIDKGILVAEKRKIDRLATDPNTGNTALHSLSEKQKEALTSVKSQLLTHPVGLLHGITGSGKTQIYVALINEVIQQNKQAFEGSAGVRIGPFTFGGTGGHQSEYTKSTAQANTFKGSSTSVNPPVLCPTSRQRKPST